MTLKDFAERQPRAGNGRTCWVCSIPERAELEQAHADGVSPTTMARWLVEEQGHTDPVTSIRQRLYHHFHGGHVAQAAR